MTSPPQTTSAPKQKGPVARYWQNASGFWRGRTGRTAWSLTVLLIIVAVLELLVKYRLNFWNRDFFNALEQKDSAAIWTQALLFAPIVAASTGLAMLGVWGRMTTQRKWRHWLTEKVIAQWLDDGRYRDLDRTGGEHQNPEYRIAEDVRVATDAPVDFATGLLTALLTAITFIDVLWNVGGSLAVEIFGTVVTVPGYLVIAVVLYSMLTTSAMIGIGHRMVNVVKGMDQAEAELRYEATHLRERGEANAPTDGKIEDGHELRSAVERVIQQWRDLCTQLIRTTLISHGNSILASVIPLILCAPKYLADTITLGEVVQAAAAFVAVQAAFNWLTDNYPRIASWTASAHRVASLLYSLDGLNHKK